VAVVVPVSDAFGDEAASRTATATRSGGARTLRLTGRPRNDATAAEEVAVTFTVPILAVTLTALPPWAATVAVTTVDRAAALAVAASVAVVDSSVTNATGAAPAVVSPDCANVTSAGRVACPAPGAGINNATVWRFLVKLDAVPATATGFAVVRVIATARNALPVEAFVRLARDAAAYNQKTPMAVSRASGFRSPTAPPQKRFNYLWIVIGAAIVITFGLAVTGVIGYRRLKKGIALDDSARIDVKSTDEASSGDANAAAEGPSKYQVAKVPLEVGDNVYDKDDHGELLAVSL